MKLPLHQHLNELRKRFVVVIIFLLIFFIIGFSLSNFFIKKIINDLIFENIKIIGLTPVEYILTKIKISFILSLIITIPIIIYQLLIFITPGLNKKERGAIKLILPSFILLFLIGIVFAYFIFLPVAIYFLSNLSRGIIENIWSINRFVSFVLYICFSFGLIFQLPLLLMLLQRLNILNVRILKKYRAHVYVLIFVIAAVITPPDVITQIIIALPLILLYELSLLFIH